MEIVASPILVSIGSIMILVANIIWFRSKLILNRKGYQVGWVTRHFDDYPNLLEAIKSETDKVELRRLMLQKKLMISICGLFPLGAILIFSGAK